MKVFQIFTLAALSGYAAADIVVDNEILDPTAIYDFVTSDDSAEDWKSTNTKKYYCTYRNLWSKIDHPQDYPQFARLSDFILYSSTTGFLPWRIGRQTTVGVETLAEAGFDGKFLDELQRAGTQIYDQCAADAYTLDQVNWEENYVFLPPIEVTDRYRYLNGITAMSPSPDWFTGLYLFDTVDEYDRTFFNSFIIHTYPWDAGTDLGDTYTSFDKDAVPADIVRRITKSNAPGGNVFISPEGSVKPVGELECKLYVCTVDDAECLKPNWPPSNRCDTFRFPRCDEECDPDVETVCQECAGVEADDGRAIFYENCCESGRDPVNGSCNNSYSGATAVTGVSVGLAAIVGLLGFIL